MTYLALAPLRRSLSRYTSCPAILARTYEDDDEDEDAGGVLEELEGIKYRTVLVL